MTIHIQLALLLTYLVWLVILQRCSEFTLREEPPEDLKRMSVARLKAILEHRGVDFENVVDKYELKHLVEATGHTTHAELTFMDSSETVPVVNFTRSVDLCTQLFYASDMWLLEINVKSEKLLSNTTWLVLQKKLSKFGFKFGRFDCIHDMRFCQEKGWLSSRLVLAEPVEDPDAMFCNPSQYSYTKSFKIESIFRWIKQQVNQRVEDIVDVDDLTQNWLNFDPQLRSQVRVIYASRVKYVHFFLSSLSAKFPGRVKLGMVNVDNKKGQAIMNKLNVTTLPSYIVVTEQRTYTNYQQQGDYNAWETFLKSIYPSARDTFELSLLLMYICVCFETCFTEGSLSETLKTDMFILFRYHVIHVILVVIMWVLLQLPCSENLTLITIQALRQFYLHLVFSDIHGHVFCTSYLFPLTVLICMMTIVRYVKHEISVTVNQTQATEIVEMTPVTVTVNQTQGSETVGTTPCNLTVNQAQKTETVVRTPDNLRVNQTQASETEGMTPDNVTVNRTEAIATVDMTPDNVTVNQTLASETAGMTPYNVTVNQTQASKTAGMTPDNVTVNQAQATETVVMKPDNVTVNQTQATECEGITADEMTVNQTQAYTNVGMTHDDMTVDRAQSSETVSLTPDNVPLNQTQAFETVGRTSDNVTVNQTHATETVSVTSDNGTLTQTQVNETVAMTPDNVTVTQTEVTNITNMLLENMEVYQPQEIIRHTVGQVSQIGTVSKYVNDNILVELDGSLWYLPPSPDFFQILQTRNLNYIARVYKH